jgi:signal transduction histidine kinase
MLSDLDQMKAMVEAVLVYLRDGRSQESMTKIDLATSLQTIADQFADQFAPLGHDVRYAGPDHAAIMARPDALHRAIANLVDNAVRYGGGKALIRLAVAPAAVTITIEDDGPGIPEADTATMLEPFMRGEAARTMDSSIGFGLGLSIARAVIEAHGGSLTLANRTPCGLVATITLPCGGTPSPIALTPPRQGLH